MVIHEKASLNPRASIKLPQISGMMAPPTIAIHNNPEPLGFKSPVPSMANVKMVGNIIELNKPTAKMLHIEIKPVLETEMIINAMAILANMPSTFPGFMILVK